MNICFVTESLDEKHGYGRVSVDLIRELSKHNITGPILTLKSSFIPNDLKQRTQAVLDHHPLQPLSHPASLFSDWSKIRKVAKSCNGIHFLTESFLATMVFGYKTPYVVTVYGTWAIKPLISNIISKKVFSQAYNNAKQVIAISNETKKRLNNLNINQNVRAIHLGINSNRWLYKRPHSNKPLQNALTVAALTPSKGLDIALRGIINYSKYSQMQYVIVGGKGDENYKKKLEEYAKDNNYASLKIHQSIDDEELTKCYKNADVFILPSIEINGDFEGFGLIILEAFAASVPVIATKSGAIPEIVQHGETGLLVPEDNSLEMEQAIKKLNEDKDLRLSLVENGVKKLEYFSLSRMVKEYEEIYVKSFT